MSIVAFEGHVLALSGGVGGAKLAAGLAAVLPPQQLTVVCNTADDFEHLGLTISPDIDSVLYALAGVHDPERGWGRADEGWRFLEALAELGGETWFRLGDRDLATHVERTRRLRAGETLSGVTAQLAAALGIGAAIVPMTDDPVRTVVQLQGGGELPFQHYFVREQCAPAVRGFRFDGIDTASPSPAFLEALQRADLAAVILCPSNPFVSIDPILALAGVEPTLRELDRPRIAISPIIAGAALKGPAAKMMHELGLSGGAEAVAAHYARRSLLDGFVLDTLDAALEAQVAEILPRTLVVDTVMRTAEDRVCLARRCLEWLSASAAPSRD